MDSSFSARSVRLETGRLLLRPWTTEDLDDFYSYARIPGLGEMAGWPHHKNREESRKILENFMAKDDVLALVDRPSGRVIGSLGVHLPAYRLPLFLNHQRVWELGYALHKDYWGQGLMPEAVRALSSHLFMEEGANALVAYRHPDNLQSGRVMEKSGFLYNRILAGQETVRQEYILTREAYLVMTGQKPSFESDYTAGCHPAILEALIRTNQEETSGYGLDPYSEEARSLIRDACRQPSAHVHFLVGGTQANLIAAAACLKPWQGVISADTGHINVHETGAIEATGHKVLTLPGGDGKLEAGDIDRYCQGLDEDPTREHMVQPGMIYLSQPTELGTVYSREELTAIRRVADRWKLIFYIDGARLASALDHPAPGLAEIARTAHLFTIGGTKCGALFGEALVILEDRLKEDFRSLIKQRGGLLAKGRLLGLQFAALFKDGLYYEIGRRQNALARRLVEGFTKTGIPFYAEPQSNQIFVILTGEEEAAYRERALFERIMPLSGGRAVCRFVTSYATSELHIDRLFLGS